MIFELLTDLAVKKIEKEVVEKVAKTAVAKTAVKATEKLATDEIARRIIKRGMQKAEELTKTVKDGDTVYRQEVRLADVKDAIKKLDTKTRYTKKELKKLENMFNVNRLKANTYQYIDMGIERITSGDIVFDKSFTKTINLGTVSESPITKVRNLGKEINKILKDFDKISEGSQEQIVSALSKLKNGIIKDPINLSKGLNLSKLTETDADTLINTIKRLSEVEESSHNVEAKRALTEWEEEAATEAEDLLGDDFENFNIQDISFTTVYDEMHRMFERLHYDSDLGEPQNTSTALYEFRRVGNSQNNESAYKRGLAKIYESFRTNKLETKNIRGSYRHPDAKNPIMPEILFDVTEDLMKTIQKAQLEKFRELKRG